MQNLSKLFYNYSLCPTLPKTNYLKINNMFFEFKPKWQVKSHPHIKMTSDRVVYNEKTGRRKKITSNGGSIGIWLDDKTFLVRSKLKENIELVPKKEYMPF